MSKKCDFTFASKTSTFTSQGFVTGVPDKFRFSHSNSRHVNNLSTSGLEELRDIIKQELGQVLFTSTHALFHTTMYLSFKLY